MISKISFSGAGWRVPFHLGVAKYLKEKNFIDPVRLKASGSSAGSIAALAVLLDVDMEFLHEATKEAASRVRYRYKLLGGNWTQVVQQAISSALELDEKQNLYKSVCHRLFINVTRLPFRKELISHFSSNDHLMETLIATQYVPTVCQRMAKPGTGWFYLDGSITDNFPCLGHGTLRVGFAYGYGTPAHIKPRMTSSFRHTVRPDLSVMDRLFKDGFEQAQKYFEHDFGG